MEICETAKKRLKQIEEFEEKVNKQKEEIDKYLHRKICPKCGGDVKLHITWLSFYDYFKCTACKAEYEE